MGFPYLGKIPKGFEMKSVKHHDRWAIFPVFPTLVPNFQQEGLLPERVGRLTPTQTPEDPKMRPPNNPSLPDVLVAFMGVCFRVPGQSQ